MATTKLIKVFLINLILMGYLGCFNAFGETAPTPRPAINFNYHGERIVREPLKKSNGLEPPPAPGGAISSGRLSLSAAIGQTLKNNQKILVNSYNPLKAEQDVNAANGVYDYTAFSTANLGNTKRPIQSVLDTGSQYLDVLHESKWSNRTGVKKLTPTGATISAYQELNRLASDSTLVLPNPQTASNMVIEASQPLLQGFWNKTNRAVISIAKFNVDISNEEFRQTVMDVVVDVVKNYWQLVMEREYEIIARQVLEMAEELLQREKSRLDRGLSSNLETDRTMAAVENRRAEYSRAQTRVKMISDQLKLLLSLPQTSPEIEPVSKPYLKPAPVDLNQSLEAAKENRPELEIALKNLNVSETRKDVAKNNRLPKLNAILRLTRNGIGVTPGPSLNTLYSQNYNNLLGGLEFEYPLGNNAAKAEFKKRTLECEQSLQEINRLGEQITNEVKMATREINLSQKEIPTTLQAKEASERVKDNERTRFELGEKSVEDLLQAQMLWAGAARDYVRAVMNYNISLVTLGRAKGTLLKELGVEIQK